MRGVSASASLWDRGLNVPRPVFSGDEHSSTTNIPGLELGSDEYIKTHQHTCNPKVLNLKSPSPAIESSTFVPSYSPIPPAPKVFPSLSAGSVSVCGAGATVLSAAGP